MKLSEVLYVNGMDDFNKFSAARLARITHLNLAETNLVDVGAKFFERLSLGANLHCLSLEKAKINAADLQRILAILHTLPKFKILIHRNMESVAAQALDLSSAQFVLIPAPKQQTARTPPVDEVALNSEFKNLPGWHIRQNEGGAQPKCWTKTEIQMLLLAAVEISRGSPNIVNFSHKRTNSWPWSVRVIGGLVHLVPKHDLVPPGIDLYNTKDKYVESKLISMKLAITFAGNDSLEPCFRLVKMALSKMHETSTVVNEVVKNNLFGNPAYLAQGVRKTYISLTPLPGLLLNELLFTPGYKSLPLTPEQRLSMGFSVMLMVYREFGIGQAHNDLKPVNMILKANNAINPTYMAQLIDFAGMHGFNPGQSFVYKDPLCTSIFAAPENMDRSRKRVRSFIYGEKTETYSLARNLEAIFDNTQVKLSVAGEERTILFSELGSLEEPIRAAHRATKITEAYGADFYQALAKLLKINPQTRGTLPEFMTFVMQKYPQICNEVLKNNLQMLFSEIALLATDPRFIHSPLAAIINPWLDKVKNTLAEDITMEQGLELLLRLDLVKGCISILNNLALYSANKLLEIVIDILQQVKTRVKAFSPAETAVMHSKIKVMLGMAVSLRELIWCKLLPNAMKFYKENYATLMMRL